MRTIMKVIMDVTAANNAIKNGTIRQIMKSTMDRIHPEASYFTAVDGCRTCFMVFDLKDPAMIPSICEPFFLELNAKIELSPCMNADELRDGLEMWEHTYQEEHMEAHA